MVRYYCDRCGKEVCSRSYVTQTTLQTSDEKEVKVDLCSDCCAKYITAQANAKIGVDTEFLKEIGAI